MLLNLSFVYVLLMWTNAPDLFTFWKKNLYPPSFRNKKIILGFDTIFIYETMKMNLLQKISKINKQVRFACLRIELILHDATPKKKQNI